MWNIRGDLPTDTKEQLAEGLVLEDGTKTLPACWKQQGEASGCLTIQEGKFHQVKRMFEALGCQVTYLKRLSMGSLKLDPSLRPGEYRALTSQELENLKERNARHED